MSDSIRSLARGGTFVAVGVPRDVRSINFEAFRLIEDELTITGARCATRQEIKESLELVRRGLVKPAVLKIVHLEDVKSLFDEIEAMRLIGRSAIVFD
jgi:propanol-preferring alcohol dehydrogenase